MGKFIEDYKKRRAQKTAELWEKRREETLRQLLEWQKENEVAMAQGGWDPSGLVPTSVDIASDIATIEKATGDEFRKMCSDGAEKKLLCRWELGVGKWEKHFFGTGGTAEYIWENIWDFTVYVLKGIAPLLFGLVFIGGPVVGIAYFVWQLIRLIAIQGHIYLPDWFQG